MYAMHFVRFASYVRQYCHYSFLNPCLFFLLPSYFICFEDDNGHSQLVMQDLFKISIWNMVLTRVFLQNSLTRLGISFVFLVKLESFLLDIGS